MSKTGKFTIEVNQDIEGAEGEFLKSVDVDMSPPKLEAAKKKKKHTRVNATIRVQNGEGFPVFMKEKGLEYVYAKTKWQMLPQVDKSIYNLRAMNLNKEAKLKSKVEVETSTSKLPPTNDDGKKEKSTMDDKFKHWVEVAANAEKPSSSSHDIEKAAEAVPEKTWFLRSLGSGDYGGTKLKCRCVNRIGKTGCFKYYYH